MLKRFILCINRRHSDNPELREGDEESQARPLQTQCLFKPPVGLNGHTMMPERCENLSFLEEVNETWNLKPRRLPDGSAGFA